MKSDRLPKMVFRRGTLSDADSDGVFDTVSSLNGLAGSQKNWNLDAVGNWSSETTDGSAVNRTHDAQNELTAVGSTNLTYDNAGSLTTDQEGRALVYDAWNRLVSVLDEPEGGAIQQYTYDAAGRRVSQDSGTLTDLYYSANWQLLEERESELPKTQYVWSPTYIDELILRDQYGVSTAGTLDTTFGSGGITYTEVGSGEVSDSVYSAAVQSDGKIVVAGSISESSDSDIVLVRYNVNGSLDTSFDSDGIMVLDLGEYGEMAMGVAIQADGKIVVAGSKSADMLLARFNSDGSADTSFGTNDDGVVITESGYFRSLTLQPDGKIVAVGTVLARFNSDGSLDTSFDSDGIQSSVSGNAVALQSDGKIVVAGTASENFRVSRVTTSGSLDTTFDSDGIATVDMGNTDIATSVAIQADDKIVVAGHSDDETQRDFALARFTTSGSLDTSFDSDGKVLTDFDSDSVEGATAVAIQPDGKIVAAGMHYDNYSSANVFALARYNTDGSLDLTATTSIQQNDGAQAVILADGRIILAGVAAGDYGDGRFGVAVFRSGLPQRLNVQTDANHNVTSIADGFATPLARYAFGPYGERTVLNPFFGVTSDAYSWRPGFQGGLMDPVTHNWHFRNRDLNSYLGRWFQADPIGYPDGPSRYQAMLSSPLAMVDPDGLATRGPGHHVVPWAIFDGKVSRDVHDIFNGDMGRLYEEGYAEHNGKTYNGVTRAEYQGAVKTELDAYVLERKKKLKKLNPCEAQEFLDRIYGAPPESVIGRYNRGVHDEIEQMLLAKGKLKPEDMTPAKREKRFKVSTGKRLALGLGALVGGILMGMGDAAGAVAKDENFREWFARTREALERGGKGQPVNFDPKGDLFKRVYEKLPPLVGDEANDWRAAMGAQVWFDWLATRASDTLKKTCPPR